ncbi:MAG: hypothetical protein Q9184_004701 [Pyrenodesmia sp. 2 TL-2023]
MDTDPQRTHGNTLCKDGYEISRNANASKAYSPTKPASASPSSTNPQTPKPRHRYLHQHRPGECCRPHEEALLPNSVTDTILDYSSTNIFFTSLLYGQSGAGWGAGGRLANPTLIYEHMKCAEMPVVPTGGPMYTGKEEVLRTPTEGRLPTLQNMALAAAWVISTDGHVGFQRPRRWRYPNMYTVKGVDYWKGQGSLSESGRKNVGFEKYD